MELTLKAMIGQRLVAGFPGYEITDALRSVVKEYKVGNIILFAENVRDCAQLRRLCAQLQELIRGETGLPAFITIDQEGGVVSRLGEDAAVVPGAMCVSATGNPHNAWTAGYITGRELAALGVNFDLAPVMDVNSNPQNPVIGVRSYGDTPETVARFGVEMIRGLREGGVLSCAKHFPGHGDTAVDSHLSLPRVDKSLAELEACELIPFRAAIEAGVPAVMTTHILFPQLEPDGVPATMSRRIITGLLKERLGFQGLVVSDCMMMQAIEKYFGTVNGVVAAACAGVDLMFTSHSTDLARESCQALEQAVREGRLPMEELRASVEKIIRIKQALPSVPDDAGVVGCPEHRAQVRRILEEGLALVQGELPPLGDNPVFFGCHPFRPTIASNPEDTSISFPRTMARRLGGTGIPTPADPTEEEIAAIVEETRGHSAIVIGTYNGHIRRGQLRLVEALSALGIPMACVALRNPYDLLSLPRGVAGLAAFAYDNAAMDAVARALKGELIPRGRLPLGGAR